RAGDRVLSQNPETGELAYKPVLRTTRRPESELTEIVCEAETFEASGGHPLWVAGRGWLKARELEPGMLLHGVNSPTKVRETKPGRKAATYNLIVADFHTYFVGERKILSHDN